MGSLDIQDMHTVSRLLSLVEKKKTIEPSNTNCLVQTCPIVGFAIVLPDKWQVEVEARTTAKFLTVKFMHFEETNGTQAFVRARAIWSIPNQVQVLELTLRAANTSRPTNLLAIHGQPTSLGHSKHSPPFLDSKC